MKAASTRSCGACVLFAAVALQVVHGASAAEKDNVRMGIPPGADPIHKTYLPVMEPDFEAVRAQDVKEKSHYMERQKKLLESRYDLSDRASDVMMSAGRKAVQKGVRVKLPEGVTWEKLASMSPEAIKK